MPGSRKPVPKLPAKVHQEGTASATRKDGFRQRRHTTSATPQSPVLLESRLRLDHSGCAAVAISF